jgi:hypothetical protein
MQESLIDGQDAANIHRFAIGRADRVIYLKQRLSYVQQLSIFSHPYLLSK